MHSLLNDVRYAFRSLFKKNLGLTVVAVTTLALGIGANATVFSWISSVLLAPLPGMTEPGDVVVAAALHENKPFISFSYPDYQDIRDQTVTLSGLVVFEQVPMSLGVTDGQPDRVWGMIVSGNYFDVLGVRPVLGRTFLPEEDQTPGTHPVAVIGERLWIERFGRDPNILGKPVLLNNKPFTVVGVTPEEFLGTSVGLKFDVWVPMMMQQSLLAGGNRLEHRGDHWLEAVGGLAPGVTREQANAELATITAKLAEQYPETNFGMGMAVYPFWQSPIGATSILAPVLYILLAVVAFVLLIACANVANLLLARATERKREIAIRFSLGATRWQVARQVFVESLVLSMAGGAAGLLIAIWGSGLLLSFVPPSDMPIGLVLGIDTSVLAFTLAVTLMTGMVFGMAPVLNALRTDLVSSLKTESASHTAGKKASRLRGGLVVAQIAVSLLLLISAGLLLQSLYRAQSFDPGFNPRNVVVTSLDLFASGYDRERGRGVISQILDRVGALPGVTSVSMTRRLPLGFGGGSSTSFGIEGIEFGPGEVPSAFTHAVGADYFRTMEIRVLEGRDVARTDTEGAQKVVFVNETLAKQHWPGGDALGKRIKAFGETWTIAGIVNDHAQRQLKERPSASLFFSLLQFYRADVTVIARTSGDVTPLSAAMQAELRSIDPSLLVYGARTLEAHIGPATFQQRLAGTLIGIFGAIALVMAAVGLYGVIAFSVGQRTREIGIRVALGAQRADVLRLVLGQGFKLTVIGSIIGLALASGVTQLMTQLLFRTASIDPLTYAAVTLFLCACALLACYVPARRAMRVNPIEALRND